MIADGLCSVAFYSLGEPKALIDPRMKSGNEDFLIKKVRDAERIKDGPDPPRQPYASKSEVYSSVNRALDLLNSWLEEKWLIR